MHNLLQQVKERDGSDLILKADTPPIFRIYGDLMTNDEPPLSAEEVRELAYSILTDEQRRRFEDEWELDLAYEAPGIARFRVNLFIQRGNVGAAFRLIPYHIMSMEEIGIPEVVKSFCERPRGIVIVTGPAGSGKSTTLAAMLDYINSNFPLHIVTIEDPIEFLHQDKKGLVSQREVGSDTHSFPNALKYVLRQDPDVIMVGEMRDLETIALSLIAAETGHLVFSTLHTPDAVQTVDRVIDIFPPSQQPQIRTQLASNLIGIICQTLVKRADGKGRVAAFEILVGTPGVRGLIRDSKNYQINSLLQTGMKQGMMTLDQHLAQLVKRGVITKEEALSRVKEPREFE
ncbi:type IV pilus twitching motility protein PilT, partial [bacterium]|nr:type IV pilus twitching motility protein PilT [bacterium]